MNRKSFNHAARGVEGFVSNASVAAPDALDAFVPVVALVAGCDRTDGGRAGASLSACVIGAAIVETFVEVDALIEAVLRGSVGTVVCRHPSSLGDADMSACETFHVLASLGVAVFSADRGWLNPDDFDDGVLQPPVVDPVSPPDSAAALLEECA